MDPLPPLTANDTPGHFAHRGYLDAMIASGGIEMDWDDISPTEQQLWENAAQYVINRPTTMQAAAPTATAPTTAPTTTATEPTTIQVTTTAPAPTTTTTTAGSAAPTA